MKETSGGGGPGQVSTGRVVTGLAATRDACLEAAALGEEEIELFSYDLDPFLYDHAPFVEAVKRLILKHKKNCMLILLQNNQRIQKEGHRLIKLAQRLPSKVEIRRPGSEYASRMDDFLVVDRRRLIRLRKSGHLETEVELHNPLEAARLHEVFREMWERSVPEADLRRLGL